MLRRFTIIVGLCALCLASTSSSAQQVFSQKQFEAYIAGQRTNLLSVFEAEIRESIARVSITSINLDQVVLKFDEICDLIPLFEPNTVPLEIRIDGEEFIALSSYISQATLFYLLGVPEIERPEQITDYIETEIRPFMKKLYADCLGITPKGTSLPEVIELSYFTRPTYNGRPYAQVLNAAASQPEAFLTEAFVGGLPAFFIILHEIGHYVQILAGRPFKSQGSEEFAADAYAAEIISDNDLSPTLALPVMHAFTVGEHAVELECRLATIALNDRAALQRTRELPLEYRQRLEALRQHYAERYKGACS